MYKIDESLVINFINTLEFISLMSVRCFMEGDPFGDFGRWVDNYYGGSASKELDIALDYRSSTLLKRHLVEPHNLSLHQTEKGRWIKPLNRPKKRRVLCYIK